MIVKFFRHDTGSGSAVFDYLVGKEGERPDAEIFRGDVEQQKLLIDSLEFKRQYTSGCLSFKESYELNYLAEFADIRPLTNTEKEYGLSRNCSLFDTIRCWSYSAIKEHREKALENSINQCLNTLRM